MSSREVRVCVRHLRRSDRGSRKESSPRDIGWGRVRTIRRTSASRCRASRSASGSLETTAIVPIPSGCSRDGFAAGRGPEDVQRHRVQPGRKPCVVAPLMKTRERAKERLLRHVFRLAAMPAEPVGQVDQRPLPALDDPRERLGVARKDATNVGAVGIVWCGHPFSMRQIGGPLRLRLFPSCRKCNRDGGR